MMSPPQETESEKNICSAAFLQTVISRSFSHLGTKKYLLSQRYESCAADLGKFQPWVYEQGIETLLPESSKRWLNSLCGRIMIIRS